MKIALIGASGQLGTDLKKVIPSDNLVALNYPDFDLTKKDNIKNQLIDINPDIVINTAAYNLVDRAEEHPDEAMAVNYHGVENLVQAVKKLDCTLVHFSSDYVFGADKERNTPYTEDDKPGPINQYGKSKLLGEQVVQKNLEKYFLIRTAYLFGVAGPNNIIQSLMKHKQVVDDQIISPTYSLDLAKQVWQLVQTKNYGLYHAVNQGQCSVFELAKYIHKCLNKQINLIPIKLSDLNLSAPRAKYLVLENKKLKALDLNIMRPWQETIPDYLKEKQYI